MRGRLRRLDPINGKTANSVNVGILKREEINESVEPARARRVLSELDPERTNKTDCQE